MIALGMFAKHPLPGTTKTRLAQHLGNDVAAGFSEAFLLDLLDRLPNLADRFLLCATPDSKASRSWFDAHRPPTSLLHFQPQVSFGQRIEWFFRVADQNGADFAILVGSDSPDLPGTTISSAAQLLKTNDLVFCPSSDGGYTLIGMRGSHPGLFDSVRFSSSLTLNESIDAASSMGLKCGLLRPWYDIDEIDDLCLLRSRIQIDSEVRRLCPRTAIQLRESWEQIQILLKNLEH